VDGTERQCYWQAWEAHGRLYLDTPGKVLPPGLLTDRLLTFAVAVREGKYGLGNQVKVQSIAKALRLDYHINREELPVDIAPQCSGRFSNHCILLPSSSWRIHLHGDTPTEEDYTSP